MSFSYIRGRILFLFDPISIKSGILVETKSGDMIVSVTNTAPDSIVALITRVPSTKAFLAYSIIGYVSINPPRRYIFRGVGLLRTCRPDGLRGQVLGRSIQTSTGACNGRSAMHVGRWSNRRRAKITIIRNRQAMWRRSEWNYIRPR